MMNKNYIGFAKGIMPFADRGLGKKQGFLPRKNNYAELSNKEFS